MFQLVRSLAAALVAGVAVSGCGTLPLGSTVSDRPAAQVRGQLQSLYDLTWGTPPARQALEVEAYVAYQERMAECLAQRGWAHQPAPFVDATAATRPPLDWSDVLVPADADQTRAIGLGLPRHVAAEVTPAKRWPGRVAPAETVVACEQQATRPEAIPAVDPELDDALYRLVQERTKGAASDLARSYPGCMQQAGFSVQARADLAALVSSERDESSSAPSARELKGAVADAGCRRAAHEAAMAGLDAPLKEFAAAHATRLSELAGTPAEIQARAKVGAERIGLVLRWL